MTVLELSKKLQKFIGIYREDTSGLSGKIYMGVMNAVFVSGMMIVMVMGSLVYICMNLLDMSTSTNAMIIMMAGNLDQMHFLCTINLPTAFENYGQKISFAHKSYSASYWKAMTSLRYRFFKVKLSA